jgi:hypothetical protein
MKELDIKDYKEIISQVEEGIDYFNYVDVIPLKLGYIGSVK